jgi:hypothetical protein|tara:strand:+ start:21 stop:227 length:207 start_codon:yes stop_codon:yes gene_type:complete
MTPAEEALKRIDIHQAECEILRKSIDDRLDRIEKRLDDGGLQFKRLERMIFANSLLIVGVLKGVEYFA